MSDVSSQKWAAMLAEDRRAALAGERGETAKWKALIDVERTERERLVELAEGGAEKGRAARDWWAAVADLLHAAALAEGRFQPFPADAMLRLSRVTADLGRGVLKGPVADAKLGNAPPRSWAARYDRACAAAYLARVKDGEIIDRRRNQTVAETYGFKDPGATARDLRAEADALRAEFPNFWRVTPATLRQQLIECGQRHTVAGRTEAAVRGRDKRN